MGYQQVLEFWFAELTPADWWRKDAEIDRTIQQRFSALHRAACAGECYSWRHSAKGRLAEIIVLDQFSRNIFRDSAAAFAADGQALVLAQEALRVQADKELEVSLRAFMYMPYMHSESLAIQRASLKLFEDLAQDNNLQFAIAHYGIIERFGRYPHRNAILGRVSSPEELAFLQQPGSSF
ncbi:hypothetical protein IMCC21906_00741 [Spongiibacter sp. IMCC21906]|jgi:uncharacterized protein (DUF924 family)|uniref:DUF924 family protein n=1 Tax=Spongiibacter sp. IMCC21906 TaxID=1620392 RepID=UPI00062DE3E5|nr:DUF924 family protein [Spongiibacter sp. IMCC21906]AKH68433.1 hypothetical protein IMCC21906_00741 [Spongiibacter sp. IMCC21906]